MTDKRIEALEAAMNEKALEAAIDAVLDKWPKYLEPLNRDFVRNCLCTGVPAYLAALPDPRGLRRRLSEKASDLRQRVARDMYVFNSDMDLLSDATYELGRLQDEYYSLQDRMDWNLALFDAASKLQKAAEAEAARLRAALEFYKSRDDIPADVDRFKETAWVLKPNSSGLPALHVGFGLEDDQGNRALAALQQKEPSRE